MRRVRSVAAAWSSRPAFVVGAIFAFAALLAAYYTTKITQIQPDEIGYTKLAIEIGDLLRPISTTELGRERLNQLYPLTIAPIYKAFGNETAFDVAHVWNALLMASTAVPAYLLARQIIRGRGWAYLFALLVVISPWMTMSAVQLTEVAAFPASVWALWGMQRALMAPSTSRDLVAFALIGLAAFGRLQLLVLAPVFVATVFAHELLYAIQTAEQGGRRAELRAAASRLWRTHRVVVLAGALGVFVGVPLLATNVLADAFGFYGNTLEVDRFPPGVWDLARSYFVFMSLGIGAVPAALAIGLVVDVLTGGADRRLHAFALLMALTVVALTIQVASISVTFTGSVVQERYVMFMAPALLLAGMALVLEGRRPAAMAVIGAVPLLGLMATTDYQTIRDSFWYLVSPSLTTFYDVIAPRLGRLASGIDRDVSRTFLLAVVTAMAVAALAAALLRFRRTIVLGALGALLVAFSLVVTTHAFHRVVYGGATGPGQGAGTTAGASWIDAAVPESGSVGMVATQDGQSVAARQLWWNTEFWNRRPKAAVMFGDPPFTWVEPGIGRLSASTGRILPPLDTRFVVSPTRGVPIAPLGVAIAHSPDRKLALLRVAPPLRARWAATGVSDDGWLSGDRPATVRVYGLRRSCLRLAIELALPALVPSGRAVRITGPGTDIRSRVLPGDPRTIKVRACGGPEGRPVRFHLIPSSNVRDAGAAVPLMLSRIEALTK